MSGQNAEAKGEQPVDASFQPGQLVDGKYRVERLMGVGGMAAVWAGTNERTGKRVALKVILRSLASRPAVRELFYSEGLVASRVNHPNVVTIFDVIDHDGMTCMVMELLDGEPLSRLLERKGTLTIDETTWLLLPAMRGVAAAHAQGVIHRDLKPQNIFLCLEPSGRIVTTKVLDFGISVLVERVLDLSRGLFVGTPNYMSPEHVAGVAVIDGRADVYGFGVLLYEALTGRMAFPGDASPALFHAIMNQPAPSVTSLRPDLSTGMAGIIEKAMAKRPDKRFASLDAMIAALEAELLALGLGVPSPSALPGPLDGVGGASVKEIGEVVSRQDTMLLYALPGEAPEGKRKAGAENAETGGEPSARFPNTVVVNFEPGFLTRLIERDWSWRLGWKVGLATTLGILFGIVVWKATRPVAPHELAHPGISAQVVQSVPTIVPLDSPKPVAEPPAAVVVEPAPVVAEPETVAEMPVLAVPVVEHKKAGRVRSAMVASATRGHVPSRENVAGKSGTSVAAMPESPHAPRTSPVARTPSRAGTLSADDF